jgi:small-conductance mechanosensitive channel/CRP-like cAMP-binding protein
VAGLLSSIPAQVVSGLVLLVLGLAIRLLTKNRVIASRVRLTIALALAFVAMDAALATTGFLSSDTRALLGSIAQLLFAFAIIHFVVLVTVNPLAADRVPERFPTIVQDVIVFTLFALVATLVFQEKFLTTSAVGAVVAGLALQDTLGNFVAGLAIQVEKPFRLGHWIKLGEWEGEVAEITWRAVKVRTREGNQVIIPNGELSKSALTNYSEPASPTRVHVEVGAAYEHPPSAVKTAIHEALDHEPLVLRTPPPHVLLVAFADSAITYRAHFWIERLTLDEEATNRVRTGIYYSFRRHGISIPFPIQVQYEAEMAPAAPTDEMRRGWERLLAGTDLFGLLSENDRQALAASASARLYGDGETIVRQGEPGESAYVIAEGRARVTLDPGDTEVAMLRAGQYFGEMSLLTGESRTATVRASGDCQVLEITAADFRRLILENPTTIDRIGQSVAERRAGLAKAREASAITVPHESATSFVSRIRRFLRV